MTKGWSKIAALALLVSAIGASVLATPASATVAFDSSFGTGGTTYKNGFPYVLGSTLDPDGRIVVAGSPGFMNQTFGVARFDANGKPDDTFGSGGIIGDAMPGPDLPGYVQAHASDVVVQPDHKIVLVGMYQVGSVDVDVAVVRLNADGSPDTGFGDGGRVILPIDVGAEAHAVQLAPNGDIVLAGVSFTNTPYIPNAFVLRLDANGDPVNSFGGDGLASTSYSANADLQASDVLLDGDGVLVVGSRGSQMQIWRFKSNGDIDSSYGSGGTASSDFPEYAGAGRAVRLGDGRVVVSGSSGSGFAIARFLPSGALDPSYGFGGMLTAGFLEQSAAADIAVRANGKVIAAGSKGTFGGGPLTIAMIGTTPEGLRDDSFGDGGRLTTQLPLISTSSARNVLLDSQGRLLVIGGAANGIGMVRYLVDDVGPDPGQTRPGVSLDADFPAATKAKKLTELDGDLGGEAAAVQIALRLNLSKHAKVVTTSKAARRCQWLSSSKAKFSKVKKKSGCEKKLWLRASVSRDGHWKLALKRRLPKGRYTVFVRALDSSGAAAAQLQKPLTLK